MLVSAMMIFLRFIGGLLLCHGLFYFAIRTRYQLVLMLICICDDGIEEILQQMVLAELVYGDLSCTGTLADSRHRIIDIIMLQDRDLPLLHIYREILSRTGQPVIAGHAVSTPAPLLRDILNHHIIICI